MQASQASATDLRLWCAYVQVLALLDCREEAIKVAEKALSMVEVRLQTSALPYQHLPLMDVEYPFHVTLLRLPTVP